MRDNKQKKWFLGTWLGTLLILIVIAAAMIIVDPYFHYHKGLPGITYRLYFERYMNNGIAKHFDYDAVITGSSMNQNFKTSLMDELFGTKSIKIPFSGAGFQEIASYVDTALTSKNHVKYVLWGLDYNGLNREYYYKGYTEYPEYLYDNNIWNDSSYVWNKSLLFEGLITDLLLTLQGEESTTFDEYSSWEVGSGWEQISKTYQRSEKILPMQSLPEDERYIIIDNITKNIKELANRYPNTQFLLFYTPYSALYWESLYRDGTLEKQLEAEKITTEVLLECDNITLFNFNHEIEITGDVNNYRDKEHYVAVINDLILQWIAEGKGIVTKDNYLDILQWEHDYYLNYDYDVLYEE